MYHAYTVLPLSFLRCQSIERATPIESESEKPFLYCRSEANRARADDRHRTTETEREERGTILYFTVRDMDR
jgi:hypothetical protein